MESNVACSFELVNEYISAKHTLTVILGKTENNQYLSFSLETDFGSHSQMMQVQGTNKVIQNRKSKGTRR